MVSLRLYEAQRRSLTVRANHVIRSGLDVEGRDSELDREFAENLLGRSANPGQVDSSSQPPRCNPIFWRLGCAIGQVLTPEEAPET